MKDWLSKKGNVAKIYSVILEKHLNNTLKDLYPKVDKDGNLKKNLITKDMLNKAGIPTIIDNESRSSWLEKYSDKKIVVRKNKIWKKFN